MFQNHANGPLPDLWGISLLRFHNSILSKVGVSGKPGGIQLDLAGSVRAVSALSSLSTRKRNR
jgi:hypothetical protein